MIKWFFISSQPQYGLSQTPLTTVHVHVCAPLHRFLPYLYFFWWCTLTSCVGRFWLVRGCFLELLRVCGWRLSGVVVSHLLPLSLSLSSLFLFPLSPSLPPSPSPFTLSSSLSPSSLPHSPLPSPFLILHPFLPFSLSFPPSLPSSLSANVQVSLRIIAQSSTDHSFSYSALTLWMLFLYVEVSFRLERLPGQLLNFSRPFAAHWYVDTEGIFIKTFSGVGTLDSMELGPEDVSLLERCPHFRGWYLQASMQLGPEDVSLLERCPHFSTLFFLQHRVSSGNHELSDQTPDNARNSPKTAKENSGRKFTLFRNSPKGITPRTHQTN